MLLYRIMMAFMNVIMVRKLKKGGENAGEEVKEFVTAYGKTVDFTDKTSIMGIVE